MGDPETPPPQKKTIQKKNFLISDNHHTVLFTRFSKSWKYNLHNQK